MYLDELSEDDLFGLFFLKVPGATGLDGYYRALFAAEPLLRSPAWLEVVTGYYLSRKDDSLRISYFADTCHSPAQVLDDFLSQNALEHTQVPKPPTNESVSAAYGGDELRFRGFLSTYTPIGVDIMVADLLHARCLFATFRFQVMLPGKPYRPHLENTFLRQSPFY